MSSVRAWSPSCSWREYVPHRTPVCESDNLSQVKLPELHYACQHEDLHRSGALSTFQYETTAYACQSLTECGAFLLGDATGTGKTRIMGAVAREHERTHRVLWLSVNIRLLTEVNREMAAIEGAPFVATGEAEGYNMFTYDSYSGLLREDKFDALRDWLRRGPSLLLLDEAHACRNDTMTHKRVDALAGVASLVMYCTATAAS